MRLRRLVAVTRDKLVLRLLAQSAGRFLLSFRIVWFDESKRHLRFGSQSAIKLSDEFIFASYQLNADFIPLSFEFFELGFVRFAQKA